MSGTFVRIMKAAIAFGVCLLLFGISADERGLRTLLQARRDTQTLALRIAALRAENRALRQRADALRNDAVVIENEARGTLGLIRRGEIVVILDRR